MRHDEDRELKTYFDAKEAELLAEHPEMAITNEEVMMAHIVDLEMERDELLAYNHRMHWALGLLAGGLAGCLVYFAVGHA